MALPSDPENLVLRCDIRQSLRSISTRKRGNLGAILAYADGRVFRYCSADSDIAVGRVCVTTNNVQALAVTYFGRSTALAPTAGEGGAVGDTKVSICVTSGITVNEYAGGYLCVTDGTGEGYPPYKVKGNEPSASSGGSLIELYEGLAVALDNTSVGVLIASPYADVAIMAAADFGSDQNQVVVGTVCAPVTGATNSRTEYFWVQTHGVGVSLQGAATGKQGSQISAAEDVNGAVQQAVEADGEYSYQVLGTLMEDGADTVFAPTLYHVGGVA